jgi:hypothetical protein
MFDFAQAAVNAVAGKIVLTPGKRWIAALHPDLFLLLKTVWPRRLFEIAANAHRFECVGAIGPISQS